MLELPHAMVGAAIVTLIPNPLISLPLALASHFITDYVPHWNPHLSIEKKTLGHYKTESVVLIIIDCFLALTIGALIAFQSSNFGVVIAGCFLAVLPDVIEIPHFFLNLKIGWIEKLLHFQRNHQWNVPIVWGMLSQILVITICLLFISSKLTQLF